jgi:hypothetical protein
MLVFDGCEDGKDVCEYISGKMISGVGVLQDCCRTKCWSWVLRCWTVGDESVLFASYLQKRLINIPIFAYLNNRKLAEIRDMFSRDY